MDWRQHADAAATDLTAAQDRELGDKQKILEHLQDAAQNLDKAIDSLNEEVDSEYSEEEKEE